MSPLRASSLALDDDDVAVEDARLDHRVALDAEQEVGARPSGSGTAIYVLDVLLGEQRPAGGDPAERAAGVGTSARGRRCLARRCPISSIARGFVGSRRIRPTRSRFARCACTVDGEASPTSSPISRTVGG